MLTGAGFELLGKSGVIVPHAWTTHTLTGFLLSTSFLSAAALGTVVPAFRADLARRLLQADPSGRYGQDVSFACDLARRPATTARTPAHH